MKRILLIDHPQFTSATFFLWHGLKELEELYPGNLSVSCYPFIPTNYDESEFDLRNLQWFKWMESLVERSRADSSQLPRGIPPFHSGEGLTSQGEMLMRRGCPWRQFKKVNIVESEEQAIRELNEHKFDVVVLGNSHRVPTILLARLKERVRDFPPVIYFDAGERDELNEHWVHVFRPNLVFKQILTPEVKERGLTVPIQNYSIKMYPMPLSSPLVGNLAASIDGLPLSWLREQSKTSQKMLPVFYWMGNTWPAREAVLRALDDLVHRRNLSRVKSCAYLSYHFVLAMSRMAVTMRGSGRDTTRYWEIPLYKTAMVSDGTMGCIHPYPFEDRKTAFFYRSTEELVRIVEGHLTDNGAASEEVNRVALAGQVHLERYHSAAARAVFFIDILHRELNFADQELLDKLALWKAEKRWDGRPWEGPVV